MHFAFSIFLPKRPKVQKLLQSNVAFDKIMANKNYKNSDFIIRINKNAKEKIYE